MLQIEIARTPKECAELLAAHADQELNGVGKPPPMAHTDAIAEGVTFDPVFSCSMDSTVGFT